MRRRIDYNMKFDIEISREQHTTVRVEAGDLEEAMEMAFMVYNEGQIPESNWYDYDDGVEIVGGDLITP